MMTRRYRAGGICQQPTRVLSPEALDYMSALVQSESSVGPMLSQEYFKEGYVFFLCKKKRKE